MDAAGDQDVATVASSTSAALDMNALQTELDNLASSIQAADPTLSLSHKLVRALCLAQMYAVGIDRIDSAAASIARSGPRQLRLQPLKTTPR